MYKTVLIHNLPLLRVKLESITSYVSDGNFIRLLRAINTITVGHLLFYGFDWRNTKEGHEYWESIKNEYNYVRAEIPKNV